MLRSIFRRPRSIRVPVQNGPVDIQRVAVLPKSSPFVTKFLLNCFFGFCIIRTVEYAFPSQAEKSEKAIHAKIDKLRKAQESRQDDPGHEGQKHQDGTFPRRKSTSSAITRTLNETKTAQFMLPVYFRRKSLPPYQPSDQEWQDFLTLQKDKKRCRALKFEVTKMITQQFRQPQHAANLRHIQADGRVGFMLEVVPPLYPPSAYEVPCVFVEPDGMRLGWRTLPDSAGGKLERIFHPTIFAQAFGAGVTEFAILTLLITRARVLDWWDDQRKTNNSASNADLTSSNVARNKHVTRQEQLNMQPPFHTISDKRWKVLLPFLRGDYGQQPGVRTSFRNTIRSMTYQTAIDQASIVFNAHFLVRQMAALVANPRGACQIKGFVECLGARGRYRLEIVAIYMPSEKAFMGKPMVTGNYVINDLPKWNPKEKQQPQPGPVPELETAQEDTGVKSASDPSPQTATRPTPGKDTEK